MNWFVKHNFKRLNTILLILSLFMTNMLWSQKENYKSKVPKFEFSTTLKKQEKELKNNTLLQRFIASREQLLLDPHPSWLSFCKSRK